MAKGVKNKSREKPGTTGKGDWFRIVVRPKEEFISFRYHDVGEKGGDVLRLAGMRKRGSWDTQTWLINKKSAHIEDDELVPDTEDAKEVIENLGSVPTHIKGDFFEAKDRPDIPERKKPTEEQQRAYMHNIRLTQRARHK